MEHPVWTFIALCIFWIFMLFILADLMSDKNAIIRFIGYFVAIVLAVATLLFVLHFYLGIHLIPTV